MLLYYGDRTKRGTAGMSLARAVVDEFAASAGLDFKRQRERLQSYLQGQVPQCFFEGTGRGLHDMLRKTFVEFVPELVKRVRQRSRVGRSSVSDQSYDT
ncbi:hypothetical protein BGW38_009779 [Lunasporangiospora selenospora]|uniref:Uncharacterized protein n=1 Tax=Lunasporangiospora selenospora TaxID=979761 RepID=A0A9P6K1S1_9FUNG|nr:hypothetical protein BGW38_009779 [Lunasporangiospora selenospora]